MPSQNHGEEGNNRNQETGIGVLTSDYWTGSLVPFSPRVRICASVTVAIEILLPPFCLLPSAQCPAPGAQSAPFPDVVLLGRRFRRTRRPVYPLPRPYRAHRATAQLSSAKRAWLVISRLARKLASWPRTLAGLLPSTKQGLRPVPPFQFQPFVPPGPVRPFHASHPVAWSLLGLALSFVFTSHTCLASSFPPPPPPPRPPPHPWHPPSFDDVVPLNAITTRRPPSPPDRLSNRTERTSRGSACLPMLTVS